MDTMLAEGTSVTQMAEKIEVDGVVIMVPELGVSMAMHQYFRARDIAAAMSEYNWETTHRFFADMGGFYFGLEDEEELRNGGKLTGDPAEVTELSLESARSSVELGDIRQCPIEASPKLSRVTSTKGRITTIRITEDIPDEICTLEVDTSGFYDTGIKILGIARLLRLSNVRFPSKTRESIQDRSKADALTKALAIAQSTWLITQSIARTAADLPILQLELGTMAFVFCACTMYGF